MTGGKDETIAIRPIGGGGIELQVLSEKNCRNIRHAHRHAGVTRIGGLYGIHGQRSDRIGTIEVIGMKLFKRCDVQGPVPLPGAMLAG